ncbi:MAG TPA: CARDB domain-containing protein, partial [Thermoanaerobaculia bacterium]
MKRRRITNLVTVFIMAAAPLNSQVDTALDQARTWLVAAQNADGSLGSFTELAPRDSAVSVLALHGGAGTETAVVQAAIYLQGVPEANTHFRSQRALALAAAERAFEPLLDTLLDFRNGGGMGGFIEHQSTLLDTALAVEALALDESGRLLDIVGLLDYLQLHQRGDGGWGIVPEDTSDVYSTAQIVLALTSLDQLSVASEVVDPALTYLVSRQQPGGAFGSVVETAVAYRALLAAGVSPTDLAFGSPVPALLAAQQASGSWEGDVYVTAEVMRTLRRQQPNLKVVDLVASSELAIPGSVVRLSVTVRNTGPEASGDGFLAIRLDSAGGEELVEVALPALESGQSTTLEVDVDTTGREGILDLVAVADSREEIGEGDEDDNTASVRVTLHAGPDLAVFAPDLSVAPETPRPDQSFNLLVQVRNLGETEVASFG